MTSQETDRNLLFGVLALQLDLIDAGQFAEACSAWAGRKDVPLADLMVGRGWVSPADRADVERVLRRKLDRNGGDARRTLTTVSDRRVGDTLGAVTDPEVRGALTELASGDARGSAPTADYHPVTGEPYPLLRLHAQGGLGRVWLARDVALEREVALKELNPERADDPWYRARFLQEARITGQLEHPGIVPVYELGSRPGDRRPFYTMRFIRGRTLTAAVRDHHRRRAACATATLELTGLLNAFIAACNAVAYAHSRGVIHRDLKGQNIVLGEYGEVVVVDWGLAKLVGQAEGDRPTPPVVLSTGGDRDQTLPGQHLGTPGYMAPEQADGRVDLMGTASDIYGLGAVLYEILTGQPPFRDSTATEAVRQAREGVPMPPPRDLCPAVPRALEAVCQRALAHRPGDRYRTAGELASEVQRWLVDEPVSAYPDPPAVRAGRWARRHRSAVTGSLALLVAAVGVLSAGTLLVVREQARTAAAYRAEARQRARSEANYQLARAGVDRLYYKFLDNPLLYEPHMDTLRRDLLETTLESYRELAEGRPRDHGLRSHLGFAYLRRARVAREHGQWSHAAESAEKAIPILEAVARDVPSNEEYLSDVAVGLLDLGQIYQADHQTERALTAVGAAVRIWRGLAARPGGLPYRQALGTALDVLGVLSLAAGRLDRCDSAHAEALTVWAGLDAETRDTPRSAEVRYRTALCHAGRGALAVERKQYDRAGESFRSAAEILDALQRARPTETYRDKLAWVDRGLARVHEETGDLPGARAFHGRALALWEGLAGDHPVVVDYAYNRALSHHLLAELDNPNGHPPGDAVRAQAQYKEAEAELRVLAGRHREDPSVRNAWARTCLGLGRCYQADRRPDEARSAFRKAFEIWEELKGDASAEYRRRYRDELRSRLDPPPPGGAGGG